MKYVLLLPLFIIGIAYAEPIECKDELAKAIVISTTALEIAKKSNEAGMLEAELKDLEENTSLLLFYYHTMYMETIEQHKVERTLNRAFKQCKDVRCMLEISANHLQKMQDMQCNITKY